jgi:hypothetical protein
MRHFQSTFRYPHPFAIGQHVTLGCHKLAKVVIRGLPALRLCAITMARWQSRYLAFLLLLPVVTLMYFWGPSYNLSGLLVNSPPSQQSPTASPKITIIAIWNPRDPEKPASYLPLFFASVKANPLIELLFIEVDKYNVGRCHEPIPHGAPNIKEICFSMEEYSNLHADFLCNHWGCEGDDRVAIMDKLHKTIPGDNVCFYIFNRSRNSVFNKA